MQQWAKKEGSGVAKEAWHGIGKSKWRAGKQSGEHEIIEGGTGLCSFEYSNR